MFLPRVVIGGRLYWRDDRLQEFRAVHDYQDRMSYSFISPESDLVVQEPPLDGDEPEALQALREELLRKALAIQNFGVELALGDGVPEFENDASNVTNADELKLHLRFWRLQADYQEALAAVEHAAAQHDHADDEEPSR